MISTLRIAATSPTRERFGNSSMSSADGWRSGVCRCAELRVSIAPLQGRRGFPRGASGSVTAARDARRRHARLGQTRGSATRLERGSRRARAVQRARGALRPGDAAGAPACAVLPARPAARAGRGRPGRRRRGEDFARGLRALRGRVAERLGLGDHVAESLQALVGDRAALSAGTIAWLRPGTFGGRRIGRRRAGIARGLGGSVEIARHIRRAWRARAAADRSGRGARPPPRPCGSLLRAPAARA